MFSKRWLAILLVCALLLPAAALGETASEGEAQPPVLSIADAPPAQADPLNAFAFRLLAQALEDGADAPAISPLSLYLALSMTALGAEDDTRAGFTALLGLEGDALTAYCAQVAQSLAAEDEALTLSIANSLWADDSLTLEDAYRARIEDEFGADAFQLDLSSQEALAQVNAWVFERTKGLIESMRNEPYPEDTALVLLNAVYMRALWQDAFEAEATQAMDFVRADGSTVSLDFLCDWHGHRALIRLDGAEGVVLPYIGDDLAFVALRPTDGQTIDEYARSLTAQSFADALAARERVLTNFAMPKFSAQCSLDLNGILKQMGLEAAFDARRADFTAMGHAPVGPLFISSVIQKLKLIVDEAGTEAAAVTEIAMVTGAMMDEPEPVELTLDSPFVYAVAELETGHVLFLGVYRGE